MKRPTKCSSQWVKIHPYHFKISEYWRQSMLQTYKEKIIGHIQLIGNQNGFGLISSNNRN